MDRRRRQASRARIRNRKEIASPREHRAQFHAVAIRIVVVFVSAALGGLDDNPEIAGLLVEGTGLGKDRVRGGVRHISLAFAGGCCHQNVICDPLFLRWLRHDLLHGKNGARCRDGRNLPASAACLQAVARPRARCGRLPTGLPRERALGPPDDPDARAERFDSPKTSRRPKHRAPRRTSQLPPRTPPHHHRQNHCGAVDGLTRIRC